MSLGFILLLLWVFVFDMDIIIGIVFLVLSGWFGGDADDMVEEVITPQEQVIEVKQPVIQTETLSSKETCEANAGVWVDAQKTCY